jgi:hypothetical protein
VQHIATGILCLKGQDYDERPRKIPTLEERRRGDLIQTFKIMTSIDKVNLDKRSNVRHHFLTNRISETWNGLTQEIVDKQKRHLIMEEAIIVRLLL